MKMRRIAILLFGMFTTATVLITGAVSFANPASGTAASIPVGTICSCSGAQAANQGGEAMAVQAWADWINAKGGLDGHHIKLYTEDDAGNATTALTDVQQLIGQDHVVAIVGDGSNVDLDWASYVASQGVPVVGGTSLDSPFFTNADFFPTASNAIAGVYGMLAQAKAKGTKFGQVYCAESPQCAQQVTLDQAFGKPLGVDVAAAVKASSTAPDYTSVCQELKDAGVESYDIAANSAVILKMTTQCKQEGLKATYIGVYIANKSFPQTKGTRNSVVIDDGFPFFDDSTPATRQFQAAMKKYAPHLGALFDPQIAWQWTAGQLFDAAVKAAPSGTVTADSVKQGLYSLKNETLDGLSPPLTFTSGKPTIVDCYFVYGVGVGHFTTPQGLKTSCAPKAAVAGILSQLG